MWSILGQPQSRSCQLVFLEPGPQHSYHLKIHFSSKENKSIANLTERAIHGSVHQVMITIWHGAFEDHLFLNKSLASYFNSQACESLIFVQTHSFISGLHIHVQCYHSFQQHPLKLEAWEHFSFWSPPFGRGWPLADSGTIDEEMDQEPGHNFNQLFTTLHYNICCNIKTSYYFL